MAAEVAAKNVNLQQQLQAVKDAAKRQEAFMASVLHDRTVQAVNALQQDRESAAAKFDEEKARVAEEARRAIAEVQGQAQSVLQGAAQREQEAHDEVAKTKRELQLQKQA